MRELSDRSPAPGAAHVGSDRAPIIEPSALRRRSSNPPAVDDAEPVSSSEERLQLISFPPDAVVPGTTSSEDIPASKRFHGGEAEIARQEAPTEVPGAVAARQDASPGAAEVQHDTDVEGSYEALLAASTQARPTSPSKAPAATQESDRTQPLAMAPGSVELAPAVQNKGQAEESAKDESTEPGQQHDLDARAPEANARDPGSAHLEPAPPPAETAQEPPTRGRAWGWWALLLAGGAVVVVVLYRGNAVPPAPAPAVSMTATPTPVAAPTPPSASPSASLAPSAAPPGETPAAADTPAGMGRIEVTAPQGARIRIDGAIAGMGPSLSLVAGPGYHDVRIEKDGMEAHSVVEVHAGSTTLVDAASTP